MTKGIGAPEPLPPMAPPIRAEGVAQLGATHGAIDRKPVADDQRVARALRRRYAPEEHPADEDEDQRRRVHDGEVSGSSSPQGGPSSSKTMRPSRAPRTCASKVS